MEWRGARVIAMNSASKAKSYLIRNKSNYQTVDCNLFRANHLLEQIVKRLKWMSQRDAEKIGEKRTNNREKNCKWEIQKFCCQAAVISMVKHLHIHDMTWLNLFHILCIAFIKISSWYFYPQSFRWRWIKMFIKHSNFISRVKNENLNDIGTSMPTGET